MTQNPRIKPRRLSPGDKVALIAPAGPIIRNINIPAGQVTENLELGMQWLVKQGYQVQLGKHALNRRGYFSGTDQERLDDFHAAFADDSITAIFCLVGGYGTPRLLPYIDYELIRKHPKIFDGYSDVTALNNTIFHKTGLITFEGPMSANDFRGKVEYNRDFLHRMVTSTEPFGELPLPPEGFEQLTLFPGEAHGPLIGGNLSLLAATLGTPYEIDTRGSILFIEDVDECPYRFDRMLNQLFLAGKLQDASGIIIGECVECLPEPPENPSLTLMEIFEDLVLPLKKPCFYGYPCGHGTYKMTLPIGLEATMNADTCKVFLEEAAVI